MINTEFFSYLKLKRLLDMCFALILIVLLFPVFMIVAVLIYSEDKQFPIFAQVRAGKDHKPFIIYKFRSMKLLTPNLSTEDLQKSGIDPITRIGFFLRKSSLDELPQILNILQGSMSFIGPRPALMSQTFILRERERTKVHTLYPGITGLAQVNGRDNLTDKNKIELDTIYFKNIGFTTDLKILYETINAVLSTNGNK